jgi:hypothetical protein
MVLDLVRPLSFVVATLLASSAGRAKPPFAEWRFERTVTLDTTAEGAGVQGDVRAYPLAIALDAECFDFTQARPDGADLRFASADGSPLPHAIEHWDAAVGSALVWVKLDLVKGNDARQSFRMYWGNAKAQPSSDSGAVFDTKEGFVAVWHLDEEGNSEASGYRDATANGAHATGVNLKAGSRVPARVGRGVQLAYAEQQWIQLENEKRKLFDLTDRLTFSIWAKARSYSNRGEDKSTPGYETMMAKGDNSWRLQMFGIPEWHKPPRHLLEMCVEKAPKGDLCVVGKTEMPAGAWHHLAVVHDHPKAKLYVDGVLDASDTFDEPWTSGDHPVGLGNQSQWPVKAGRFWDGVLDEARVLGVAKGDDGSSSTTRASARGRSSYGSARRWIDGTDPLPPGSIGQRVRSHPRGATAR